MVAKQFLQWKYQNCLNKSLSQKFDDSRISVQKKFPKGYQLKNRIDRIDYTHKYFKYDFNIKSLIYIYIYDDEG